MSGDNAGKDRPAAGPAFLEQWWGGIGCLLFWGVAIMGLFFGCQPARAQSDVAALPVLEQAVTVVWNPNDPSEKVEFYRVWRGLDLLGQTSEPRLRIELPTDQLSTLTVTAHRGELASAHSKRLILAPAVVHTSTDLRVWVVEKPSVFFHVLEREGIKTPRQFFRIQYHTP